MSDISLNVEDAHMAIDSNPAVFNEVRAFLASFENRPGAHYFSSSAVHHESVCSLFAQF
jgi:hypothetical protein